jgi:hypothetical protein
MDNKNTISELFEQHARQFPDHIAALNEKKSLTYSE